MNTLNGNRCSCSQTSFRIPVHNRMSLGTGVWRWAWPLFHDYSGCLFAHQHGFSPVSNMQKG